MNAATTDYEMTALIWASKRGHLDVVRELCNRGADLHAYLVEIDDYGGEGECRGVDKTALLCACEEGHLEVVHELLKRGIDPNAHRTQYGKTARP